MIPGRQESVWQEGIPSPSGRRRQGPFHSWIVPRVVSHFTTRMCHAKAIVQLVAEQSSAQSRTTLGAIAHTKIRAPRYRLAGEKCIRQRGRKAEFGHYSPNENVRERSDPTPRRDGVPRLPREAIRSCDATVPSAYGTIRSLDFGVHSPEGAPRTPNGAPHLTYGATRSSDAAVLSLFGAAPTARGAVPSPGAGVRGSDGGVRRPDGAVRGAFGRAVKPSGGVLAVFGGALFAGGGGGGRVRRPACLGGLSPS